MSLLDAVVAAGEIPPVTTPQAQKKAYSERLSKFLAEETAAGLRATGLDGVRPTRGGPSEKAFQGGLGSKKVDVSYSDEQHGLHMAVSLKTICFPPWGKNLKNRFSDMCTEAITLHMRFPYSVVCGLFAMPIGADQDVTLVRNVSTFRRATRLFATISGRAQYTDPGEKFENMTMLLFQPVQSEVAPNVKLVDCVSGVEITEEAYFQNLRSIFDRRNPHLSLSEDV